MIRTVLVIAVMQTFSVTGVEYENDRIHSPVRIGVKLNLTELRQTAKAAFGFSEESDIVLEVQLPRNLGMVTKFNSKMVVGSEIFITTEHSRDNVFATPDQIAGRIGAISDDRTVAFIAPYKRVLQKRIVKQFPSPCGTKTVTSGIETYVWDKTPTSTVLVYVSSNEKFELRGCGLYGVVVYEVT